MKTIKILIADDHTLIRESWSYILNSQQGFSVVGETGRAEEAIGLAKELQPDIVLMDINLPGISGIEATRLLLSQAPAVKVIGVSLHSQPAYARSMLQQGASGYVTKNSPREELFEAILEVQNGGRYICREVKNILSEQVFYGEPPAGRIKALSFRELQIIRLVQKGYTSRAIAVELNITLKTVEVHRHNILKKLQLKNAAALVNYVHNSEEMLHFGKSE